MNSHSDGANLITRIMRGRHRRPATFFVGALFVGVVLVGGQFLVSGGQGTQLPTVAVKSGPILIKITEIGELRALDQVTISAINDKQIIWMVPEGTWVDRGDTLLILESEKYVISSAEAESGVHVAQAELNKTLGELEAHKAKEEAAQKQYQSLPELAAKGFVMESEVEQARLSYIELKNRTRSYMAAVDGARAMVKRAMRGLAQQERKLRETVQLAPRAGLVVYARVGNEADAKKVEVGMIPFEGMDLMYLPDVSSMLVDVEISEVDLSRIKEGLASEVRLDAYPDAVFEGAVHSIGDLARSKTSRITGKATGAKIFDVAVMVHGQDRRLKPGLTATVDLIVNKYENALFVPLETIFVDELDRTVVYLQTRGKIETRVVELGASNDRVVIVKKGLQEGDDILVARPTTT